ncbi:MAG: carboxypeptidase regulatory-like domain-containing protein [Deltaproteobacteria bacterium]|nr:carboxypeptidase regulatory-like domain-containing protein [Deltaproteobacteria bacterium]
MSRIALAAVCASLLACGTQVDASNPFDPGTPDTGKARASLHGTLASPSLPTLASLLVVLKQNNGQVAQFTTDATGAFSFAQLTPGTYVVECAPDGFAAADVPVTLAPGADVDVGTITLKEDATALSSVTGAITLSGQTDNSGTLVEVLDRSFTAVTNSAGSFALSIPAGTYKLRFSHKDFLPSTTQDLIVGKNASLTVPPVSLAINPATIHGVVTAELAGGGTGALELATVTLDGTALTGLTLADGSFTLTGVPAGSYVLRALKAGYGTATVPVLTLVGGEARTLGADVVLPLSRGGISGTIALSDGHDPSDTVIELSGTGKTQLAGADGTFLFDNLLVGTYPLVARRAGYQTLSLGSVTVTVGAITPAGTFTLLANPATVRGHVDGELAIGGVASLSNAQIAVDGTSVAPQLTDASGNFSLSLPPGSYVVRATKTGFKDVLQAVLNLNGGEVRTLADSFELSLSRGALAGTVTLSDSSDASGVVVELTGTGLAQVTGSSGNYLFSGLLPGTYELTARKDGYARKVIGTVTVTADQTFTANAATLARQGGAITVNEAPYTNARGVTVSLTANNVTGFLLSEDPTFTDASKGDVLASPAASSTFRTYVPNASTPFTLTNADGEHDVSVVFWDGQNLSSPATATVVLDRVGPPQPALTIGTGAAFTNAQTGIVSLSISGTDTPLGNGGAVAGVRQMEISNFASFTPSTKTSFSLVTTWTLDAPGTDGPKTVYCRLIDAAGNVGAIQQATVGLDRLPPALGSFTLAGPDATHPGYTSTPVVTATVTASDANEGAGQQNLRVRFSNVAGMAGALYQPFTTQTTWFLSQGDQLKTVYVQLIDAAGNESAPASTTITLDTTGPGSPGLAITETDSRPTNGYTNQRAVKLTLTAGGSPITAQVANGPSLAGATSYDLTQVTMPVDYTLPAGDGTKTLWVRFTDAAGNVSDLAAASVVLDQTPPQATIASALLEGSVSGSTAVNVIPASAGEDELRIAGDVTPVPGPTVFQAVTPGLKVPVTLTATDATKVLTIQYRDLADNVVTGPSISVLLDTTAPVTAAFPIRGAHADGTSDTAFTATTQVTLDFSGQTDGAGSGIAQVRVGNASDLSDSAGFVAFAKAMPFTLTTGDVDHFVYAQFKDAAGRTSGIQQSQKIHLIQNAPAAPTLTIVEQDSRPANGFTNNAAVQLNLQSATALSAKVSEDPTLANAQTIALPVNLGALPTFTLGGAGLRTLYARVYDAAGNASPPVSASVTLDQTAPTATPAPVVSPGNGFTNSTAITITPGAAGQDELQITGDVTAPTGFVSARPGVPIAVTLSATPGTKLLNITLRDLADNTTALTAQTIVLDTAPPSFGTVKIKGALADGTASNSITAVTGVTIDLSGASDDSGQPPVDMKLSNDPALTGAVFQAFAASAPWVLTPGDGTKTVYVILRDKAGNANLTAAQPQIMLAATPPSAGSISIEGGAAVSKKASVSVAVAASGATQYRLTIDGVAQSSWSALVSGAASTSVPLVTETTHLISANFRNSALVEGAGASASILIDRTAPALSSVLLSGALGNGTLSRSTDAPPAGSPFPFTTTPAVVVSLTPAIAGDDITGMALLQIAASSTCASAYPGSPVFTPYSPGSTFVLSLGDGSWRVCALLQDRAGNFDVTKALSAVLTLDTTPPSNPSFINVSSSVTNKLTFPTVKDSAGNDTAGTVNITAVTDNPSGPVTYQCLGGQYASWTNCATLIGQPTVLQAFTLARNSSNTIGVRALDAALNASAGSFISVTHDDIPPAAPNIGAVRTTVSSVSLSWSASVDAVSYRLNYGFQAGHIDGTGAAQGASPIAVGNSLSFEITNMTQALPVYISVEAIDAAGNSSGPSGEITAVPNQVNPRLLSTIGYKFHQVSPPFPLSGTKVIATGNQGAVMLDVSTTPPAPVARVALQNLVPDDGAPLPTWTACSDSGQIGICTVPVGTTLEGAFKNNHLQYRASAPVVFFNAFGTSAAPSVGRVLATLPSRPFRVALGSYVPTGGLIPHTVIFTLDALGVRAFDLFDAHNPKLVATGAAASTSSISSPFSNGFAMTTVGAALYVYATPAAATSTAPLLYAYDLTQINTGTLPLLAQPVAPQSSTGKVLGAASNPVPVPTFYNVPAIFYVDGTNLEASVYTAGQAAPVARKTIVSSGVSSFGPATAGWNALSNTQRLYAFTYGDNGTSAALVMDATTSTIVNANNAAAAVYVPGPGAGNIAGSAGNNLLFEVTDDYHSVVRWNESAPASGTAPSWTAQTNYTEPALTNLVEKDNFVFVASGLQVLPFDVSNPLAPQLLSVPSVSATGRTNAVYTRLVVHGETLFAVVSGAANSPNIGLDVFKIKPGGLTLTARSLLGTTAYNDVIPVGHFLYLPKVNGGMDAYDFSNNSTATLKYSTATASGPPITCAGRPGNLSGKPQAAILFCLNNNNVLRVYALDETLAAGSQLRAISSAITLPFAGGTIFDSLSLSGDNLIVSSKDASISVSVVSPAAPTVSSTVLPVGGQTLQQSGYAVGLAPASEPSGPQFSQLSGTIVDGSLLYSGCAADSVATAHGHGLAHHNGVYYAICGDTGLAALTPVDAKGGKLFQRSDVTPNWTQGAAAFVTDGTYAMFGGAQQSSTASSWWAYEAVNASNNGVAAPAFVSELTASTSFPGYDIRFMTMVDGVNFVTAVTSTGGGARVQGFDIANSFASWTSHAAATNFGAPISAAPATDGELFYSSFDYPTSYVYIFDPRQYTSFPVVTFSATTQTPTALATTRSRLYAGFTQSNLINVYDTSATVSSSTLATLTPITLSAAVGHVHSIAVQGQLLFYTFDDGKPSAGNFGLGMVRLDPTNRDGGGSAVVLNWTAPSDLELNDIVIAGDTLYVTQNLGLATWDLSAVLRNPLPTSASTTIVPVQTSATAAVDAPHAGPVRLQLDGPWAYLVGGTYRVFDLR